jgi:hypothetical protein
MPLTAENLDHLVALHARGTAGHALRQELLTAVWGGTWPEEVPDPDDPAAGGILYALFCLGLQMALDTAVLREAAQQAENVIHVDRTVEQAQSRWSEVLDRLSKV